MVKKINADQFESEAVKAPVAVVDFSATWCGPCKMLAPIVEKLAADYDGRALVAKVESGSNTTTLQCGTGNGISIVNGQDFYIYLPAGDYSSITVSITSTDGNTDT